MRTVPHHVSGWTSSGETRTGRLLLDHLGTEISRNHEGDLEVPLPTALRSLVERLEKRSDALPSSRSGQDRS